MTPNRTLRMLADRQPRFGCMPRALSRWFLLAACIAGVFFAGCDRQPETARSSEANSGVSRTAQAGPITLSLTVHPVETPFDRRAELIVEATADADSAVDFADYSASLEGGEHQYEYRLHMKERRAAEPITNGGRTWKQRYEIEFFLPGEYELPPAKLTYTESALGKPPVPSTETPQVVPSTTPESERKVLKTESIRIVALETQQAKLSPEELANIPVLPPVELREPWSRWWLLLPAVLIAAVVLLLRWSRRARVGRVEPVEVISAHEWARRQFAALVAADLIARGSVQEFYYRISAIVRGYIERRYRVSAPEMTTEEFLSAASNDDRFQTTAASRLHDFLTACDLVKYARHRPAAGEWDDLMRTARDFVERTREIEVVGSGSASSTIAEAVGA